MDKRLPLAIVLAISALLLLFGCAEQPQPQPQAPGQTPAPTEAPTAEPEEPEPTPTPINIGAIKANAAIESEGIVFDRNSISVAMAKNSSATGSILIANTTDRRRQIPITKKLASESVTLALSDSMPLLEPGEAREIALEFRANAEAEGAYSGHLKFVVSGEGSDITVTVPLEVEITEGVVVEAEADANLEVSPKEYSFGIEISGIRTDTSTVKACNKGEKMMTTVEFALSGENACNWIESIQKVIGLQAGECEERELKISVPESISFGSYPCTITASSGTEQAAIALEVKVKGIADSFAFSWANAEFSECLLDDCKRLENIKIENTNEENPITLTGIQISGWSVKDKDSAKLSKIMLGSGTVWEGSATDGQALDLNEFELAAGASLANCRLFFDNFIGNDSEEFTLAFEFSDGSIFTTQQWPQYSGFESFRFSWATAKFERSGRNIAGWTIENLNEANEISIVRMKVSNWASRDEDEAEIAVIRLNDSARWVDATGQGEGWIDIANYQIPAETAYSAGNTLEFVRLVSDDHEQVIVEFEFSDGSTYKTEPWPDYPFADLWENSADTPQPVDFSTGIGSEANTFGPGAGNDGWDWAKDIYSTGDTCVRFNADPNFDNSTTDTELSTDSALVVEIGDRENACAGSGHGSGAYGIEFEVSDGMFGVIDAGGSATLLFDWAFINHGLGTGDKAWVKARIGNSEGMDYLGVNKKTEGDDDSKEIFYAYNPSDDNGSKRINVTKYIDSAGPYYLELGAVLSDWESNEWLEAQFDNIDLVFREKD